MKIQPNGKKRAFAFGDFIVAAYGACGARGAKGLVRLAVNEHLLMFRGRQRFVIAEE
jgi:hypothetical protein